MNWFKRFAAGLAVLAMVVAVPAAAEQRHKPFIRGADAGTDLASAVAAVKQKLAAGGFEVVGEYTPYAGTTIIAATSEALKKHAAATEYGGFGAAVRIGVTQAKDGVQVAYTNPVYMAHAYRMQGDLSDVRAALEKALGSQGEFGSEDGLTAEKLRKYHYKFMMPYFDDRLELAEHPGFAAAVETVEKRLAKKAGGASKVYRIDIPGKEQAVFGVHLSGQGKDVPECSGDEYIMSRIDFKPVKSTPHLPYEMVVNGGKVVALPAEFRIAISFPDLSMMGSNSFASIMCAPSAIEEALTAAAGGEEGED